MDYMEACAYLKKALTFGIRPGLERMNRLASLLGHPESGLACIHIAGTNGKGSVSSYCAAILAAAGKRVGVFTSPYLERLTERIRIIDGRAGLDKLGQDETYGEIGAGDFAAAMTDTAAAVEQMLAEGYEHPTEFELLTAIGFLHFQTQSCEVVVLETGLGGRLDSTNIIRQPLASIITALGYDHMQQLGGSLAEIAWEKAGIIKPGRPVYLYDPHSLALPAGEADAALAAVRSRATELDAPLAVVSRQDALTTDYGWTGQTFRDRARDLTLQTRLLGLFQPINAILALRAVQDLGLADTAAIREGIRLAFWPARMEVLRQSPPVILDGCHNPQGCQALAAALDRLLPGKPVVFLAGILKDKDYTGMLQAILERPAYCPAAWVCATPDSPRALDAGELAASVRRIASQLPKTAACAYNMQDAVHAAASPAAGARLALAIVAEKGMALCAFGSLYFAGGIRNILSARESHLWTGSC